MTPNLENTRVIVKGTVANTGSEIAHSVDIGAGLYDQSGKLVAVSLGGGMSPLPDDQTLPPGTTTHFLASFDRITPLPTDTRIETYVKASKPESP